MFLKVGVSTFALELICIREVIALGALSPLPNMPVYFAGLVNIRGKILSVIDLNESLSFVVESRVANQQIKKQCLVITNINDHFYGAIVDDILGVQSVNPQQIDSSVDSHQNHNLFCGIIKLDNAPLAPILNLENALRTNELLNLKTRQTA